MLYHGDARTILATLPEESAQCCVTSPPYWGLRDYGTEKQIGLEPTPSAYVDNLVLVFREVWRVLRNDGTLWLNIGDSYTSGRLKSRVDNRLDQKLHARTMGMRTPTPPGLKPKDLIGIPWMLAFALRADGWYLRADIIWAKPNPVPESVLDRPTRSHEHLFLLAKSQRYCYDADSIREPFIGQTLHDRTGGQYTPPGQSAHSRAGVGRGGYNSKGRNARDVWTIPTKAYQGAHFAVFPLEIPRRCILASSRVGDLILDPFMGSGTTCAAAKLLDRHFIGIDLQAAYLPLAAKRIAEVGK